MLPNADQVGVGLAEPTILWALGRDCRDLGSNSGQRLGSVYRGRDGVHVATAPRGGADDSDDVPEPPISLGKT